MANDVTATHQAAINQVVGNTCIYCEQTIDAPYMIGVLPVTLPAYIERHWAHVLRAKALGGEYHPRNISASHARCNWLVGTDKLETVMMQFFGDTTGEKAGKVRAKLAKQDTLYTELLKTIKTKKRPSNPDIQDMLVYLAVRIQSDDASAIKKLNSKDTILRLAA